MFVSGISIHDQNNIRNRANNIQKKDKYKGSLYIQIKLFFNHAAEILFIFELSFSCKRIHNHVHINPIKIASICKMFTKKLWSNLLSNMSYSWYQNILKQKNKKNNNIIAK